MVSIKLSHWFRFPTFLEMFSHFNNKRWHFFVSQKATPIGPQTAGTRVRFLLYSSVIENFTCAKKILLPQRLAIWKSNFDLGISHRDPLALYENLFSLSAIPVCTLAFLKTKSTITFVQRYEESPEAGKIVLCSSLKYTLLYRIIDQTSGYAARKCQNVMETHRKVDYQIICKTFAKGLYKLCP